MTGEEAIHAGCNHNLGKLKYEINILLDREEKMQGWRSHILWLEKGERNTKFCRSQATNRMKKNKIFGIRDSLGQ